MRKFERGFLLLEVIVSIVVLTGGMLFVAMSFSSSKGLLLRSRELFYSSLLMQEKLFAIQEKEALGETLRTRGNFNDSRDYAWRWEISPLAESKLEHVLLEVFPANKPEKSYSLETYWPKAD